MKFGKLRELLNFIDESVADESFDPEIKVQVGSETVLDIRFVTLYFDGINDELINVEIGVSYENQTCPRKNNAAK